MKWGIYTDEGGLKRGCILYREERWMRERIFTAECERKSGCIQRKVDYRGDVYRRR